MTLLDIIILGYVVNFVVFITMMILIVAGALLNVVNPEFATSMMTLEKMRDELDLVKDKLRKKKMSTKIQRDFIIYFPFAVVMELLSLIAYLVNGKMLDWFAIRIVNKISILEKRLHKSI